MYFEVILKIVLCARNQILVFHEQVKCVYDQPQTKVRTNSGKLADFCQVLPKKFCPAASPTEGRNHQARLRASS